MAQPAAGDSSQGVYVRDSAIAADKFELGKRMERLKEWPKSADVYQEILEKYQDRVVPTAMDDKGNPIQYASVTVAVQQRLARWPAEGLAVYLARFEPVAAVALEQVRQDDYAALHRIFALYFVTDSARQAGIRLMDLYLENGEFSAAAWIGQHLLEWHPHLTADQPLVLFRTALAYHLAGSPALADKFLQELKTQHANAKAAIGGEQVALLDALSRQLQQKPPIAVAGGGDSWPMAGGDVSRSLVSGAKGTPGAKVYSIDLPGPIVDNLNEQNKRALLEAHNAARGQNLTINVIPAVDRGELFFQDGQRMYAVHLESGAPLAGWTQTHGGNRMGQYWLPNAAAALMNLGGEVGGVNAAVSRQHTLTLTDDAILAVMGQPGGRSPFGPQVANPGGTRLVCLDRSTGKQRWIIAPRSAPADQANSRNLDFSGSPLVVGENVYVIARGGAGAGVEDCHVLCYSLANGEFRWSCYIASSQSGGMAINGMPVAIDNDTLSHLAFASGRIFVLTNLGAVAAIDAYSGATAWLSIYPRDDATIDRPNRMMRGWGWNPGMGGIPGPNAVRPWEFNPVIVSEGKVFILPTDGRYIHIYDAGTGAEVKRISRQVDYSGKVRKMTMLLAADGQSLFVAGDNVIFRLNWATYAPTPDNLRKLDEQSVICVTPIFEDPQGKEMRGRPFVTADRLYIPLTTHLAIFDLPARKLSTARFPRYPGKWPPEEGPGNVVVAEEHVIVANARGVAVYTDLEGVRQRYLAALQANLNNVEARLVFSELMFNAREFADAMTAMDDAIKVLGGLASMRPGELRDRVFSDAILFAQRIGADKSTESIALAEKLYDRAAAAARNPGQHVTYRMGRARFIESLAGTQPAPDYARAVRLYQEILNDPAMRTIGLAGDDGATVFAARRAEDAITDILRKTGPSIYEPFEKQAAAALVALAQTKDANQLLALSEQFPHSTAAAQALLQAADLYEQGANPRMATLVLRRLYWKYEQRYRGAERALLFEAMARNYLKAGNLGAALGRLQNVSKDLPASKLAGQLLTPDGKVLATSQGRPVQTLSEAAAALELYAQQRNLETLPDVRLPAPPTSEEFAAGKPWPEPFLKPEPDSVLLNVQAILRPPVDLPEWNRNDRLVIWSAGKLVCLSPAAKDAHWISPALTGNPVALIWVDKNVLVWGMEEMSLLDGAGGKVLWKADLRTLPAPAVPDGGADEPSPAPADDKQVMAQIQAEQILIQQRLLIVRGGIRALPPMPPMPVQQAPVVPNDGREYILHVRPVSDRIVVCTSTGRIMTLDLPGGRLLWQSRLSRGTVPRQTLATDEFVVIRTVEGAVSQLVVLDTYSGQPILRKKFPGAANWPLNCALSPSGMLVWTTQQTIAAKDLYEAGEPHTWSMPGLTFSNITQPDQLLIWNQNVLAVCNNGQFVTRRQLRTGQEIPGASLLNTGTADENAGATVRLRQAGPRLYVLGNRTVITYHLEQGTSADIKTEEVNFFPAEALLTRNHLILPGLVTKSLTQNLLMEDKPPTETTFTLQAHSRALIQSTETGKLGESFQLHYRSDFDQPAKVKSWQAVDGGIYYLGGDNKLYLLKGAGQ
jgi:outer membrane protein assembly factor BamB